MSELSRCLSSVLSHASSGPAGVSSAEKEDILLLFHHFHKLTLNSKAFTQLMQFIPEAALGKVPDKSLTQMMDTDQGAQEDSEDSSAALAECSKHFLQVVHLWQPSGPPELLYCMALWAFEEAASNAAHLTPTVRWFCSLKARSSEMLRNADGPKALLNMLLRAYELSASLDCRRDLQCCLDAFFFQLFKCVDATHGGHPIGDVLSTKPFVKCMRAMQECSNEYLGVFVAEAFLGASKPSNTNELMALSSS